MPEICTHATFSPKKKTGNVNTNHEFGKNLANVLVSMISSVTKPNVEPNKKTAGNKEWEKKHANKHDLRNGN